MTLMMLLLMMIYSLGKARYSPWGGIADGCDGWLAWIDMAGCSDKTS